MDTALNMEIVVPAAKGNLGIDGVVEIFRDPFVQIIFNIVTQGLSNVDLLTFNNHMHVLIQFF